MYRRKKTFLAYKAYKPNSSKNILLVNENAVDYYTYLGSSWINQAWNKPPNDAYTRYKGMSPLDLNQKYLLKMIQTQESLSFEQISDKLDKGHEKTVKLIKDIIYFPGF